MLLVLPTAKEVERISVDRRVQQCLLEFETLLAHPPILSSPEPIEDLYMYLTMSKHDVSAVLIIV